jgi:integrase
LRLLLDHAPEKLLPYIAIGALAGLRGAEICRLDWGEIDLAGGFISVSAANAKTRVRRLVPIKPNLQAWLKPHAKTAGRVCSFKNVVNQLMKLVRSVPATEDADKLEWKRNGLRHSYISYRVAECADAARVAEESGNSVAVIRSNYLQRVKPDAAREYFSIEPRRRKKAAPLRN